MKHLISAAMSFLLLFRPAVAFGINAEAAAELKSVSAAAVLDRIFVFSENSKIVSVNGKNVIADNYTKFENENIYIDKRVAIGNGTGYVDVQSLNFPYVCDYESGIVLLSRDNGISQDDLNEAKKLLSVLYSCGIYVSAYGSNSNIGTYKKPFKTIGAAINAYVECKKLYKTTPCIYITEGEYHISDTIVLDSSASGITFAAYDNQRVSINGGFRGGKITKASLSDLGGKLPKEHIDKIIKWDISEYGGLADDCVFPDFSYYTPELVNNGKVETIARWPNNDWSYTGEQTKKISDTEYEFKTDADISNMTLDNAKILGFWAWDYRLSRGNITGYDGAESTVRISTDCFNAAEYYFNSNRRYYIYNIPEEVNSPGEYYIDYENKVLYYYPENNALNLQLTGLKNGIFNLNNDCDNVTFCGLIFENARGTAISGDGSDYLTVDGCLFRNIGGRGIYISNTYNTNITKSVFKDIGDSSVEISGGLRPQLKKSNSSVNNCEFYNGGRVIGTYSPFVQAGGHNSYELSPAIGITVENNFFYNHMHSAIVFAGNDIIIRNNIFDNVVNATQDSGAIYSRLYATYRGNEITNNIFRNIRTYKIAERYGDATAIYCDDLLPGVKVESNVFQNCSKAATFGGGKAHKFNNNLVYNCRSAVGYTARANNAEAVTAPYGYLYSDVKSMENNTYYLPHKWYNAYLDYKKFVDELEKYNSSTNIVQDDNGNIEHIDKTAENINNAEFNNNIFVAPAANKSNISFLHLQSYDETTGYGVKNANPYYSTDLSKVSINGNIISASEDIGSRYTLPDVSHTGVMIKNPLYSEMRDNYEFDNPSGRTFRGYRYENFEGYNDGAPAESAKEINIISGTNSAISGDGHLVVPANEGIEIKTEKLKDNFVFSVSFGGRFRINFGSDDLTFDADSDVSEIYEFRFDFKNDTVLVYVIDENDKYKTFSRKNASISGDIGIITISALSDLNINSIALSSYDNYSNISETYLDLDFEDNKSETAVENYSESIITYGAYGHYSSLITDDGNNNQALEYKSFINPSYGLNYINTDIKFAPVKLRDNVVSIEFKMKAQPAMKTALMRCLTPIGYNGDAPDTDIVFPIFVESRYSKNLVVFGQNVTVALQKEFISDYLRLKATIDDIHKKIYVYKMVNSGWSYICEYDIDGNIPDFMDSLSINVMQDTSEECSYRFDDIRIYNSNNYLYSGKSVISDGIVNFKPDYIPGIGADYICVAAYSDNGEIVCADLQPYKPDMEVSIRLPVTDKKYLIKRFILNDSLKPILKSEILE